MATTDDTALRAPLPDREAPGFVEELMGGLPQWLSRLPADVGLIAVIGFGAMLGLVIVGFRRSRETYD
jgi:hypothetical protein